ncbi:LysR family transcriptional regulator [Hydrogenophaga laconesensis]|uniref:LysR family nitrogen assimilation transcriptional regulator n=1 Tax=Hydrogenophaga laconesensis TaxID=1805971 RepID=A0ABU1VHM4_9BURK|nr:LysR substrate-binding domain-containing protein [Hydrogenophaga laconesensis]MDR7096984.1 LysR family nitrogen assimilation transcriptional regulator [Hydrogenophaga laconesensis]
MNLKTLRYFIAVADSGSLTAAAAAIPIAQPALTRQMRDLEAEMGVQLLQRLPRGVRLTPAGVTLYESAQRIVSEAARLGRRLAHSQQKNRAPVILGASPTLARLLLPRLIENCMDAMDDLELRAREAFTPALLDWLERGMIDMAVLTNPEPGRTLSFQPLLGEPFALVSHAQMRIGPVVSVNQLARIPLLMTSLHRGLVDRQLASLGKSLQVRAEIDSVDSIRELVLRGRWATIMPVSVFSDNAQDASIVMSEISGVQLNRLLVLATRIDPRPNPSLSLVHELVVAEFSRMERLGIFSFATSGSARHG